MSKLTLTISEVQSVLEALDVMKATGPDQIPAKLLRETSSVTAPSLCKLFNKPLSTGSFQENWKEGNVNLFLFLKSVRLSAQRIIGHAFSLPSLVAKVLERCVFNTSKIDFKRLSYYAVLKSVKWPNVCPLLVKMRFFST